MLIYIFIYVCLLLCASLDVAAQTDRQLIRQGNKYYRQQNFSKAEVEYQKALAKNPRNTQAMYNLGCALMQQQKDSAAVQQLENAGKSETSKLRKAMVYHNIGVICQKHQMFGEAIEAYKESLRNNPADNETRYNLELCKRQQKKQNQNQNGGGKNDDKNKDQKDKKDQQDKQQNKDKDKDKDQDQQKQQPKEQMSKENAEQLLNAAMQEEKATQQRLKKAMQHPQKRQLQKNW